MAWRDDVSDIVTDLIARANAGAAPVSLDDWQRVCDRFGLDLFVIDVPSRRRGILRNKRSEAQARRKRVV